MGGGVSQGLTNTGLGEQEALIHLSLPLINRLPWGGDIFPPFIWLLEHEVTPVGFQVSLFSRVFVYRMLSMSSLAEFPLGAEEGGR